MIKLTVYFTRKQYKDRESVLECTYHFFTQQNSFNLKSVNSRSDFDFDSNCYLYAYPSKKVCNT